MPPGAIPFPFGDCRICKDKATGLHYGVATCEGCKGFFKRSIPKGDKYKCFFGGQCVITPQNRNRCKSCRYRKCLSLGMSFEAVKMGRIPKVEKQKALNASRVMDNGWKELKSTESPDSGIEEENQRQMFWSSGKQEDPTSHAGYPSYPPAFPHPPFSRSHTTSTSCASSNLEPVPSSHMDPVPGTNMDRVQRSNMDPIQCSNMDAVPRSSLNSVRNLEAAHRSNLDHERSSNLTLVHRLNCAQGANLGNGQRSSLDQAFTMNSSLGIHDSRCENPNMAFEHSLPKIPNFNQEKSNMSLLAEAALQPNGQMSSGEDSTGAESSSSRSRSMYSSNVIKVLFNQVVEMTDTKKVPEMMEKLAQKCPGNDGVDLLKSLSCENFFDNDGKPMEDTETMTSHNSTWPSKTEQKTIEQFDKSDFDEIGSYVSHGQPSRHFQSEQEGVQVGDLVSDIIPFYKEVPEPNMLQVDQNTYQVQHPQNRYTCSESFFSNSQVQSDTHTDIWQHKEVLGPNQVMQAEKVVRHTGDNILDDLEKGSEQHFESVILGLQNSLDKHHKQLREAQAFVATFREKGIPMPKAEITEETIKETWNQLFQSLTMTNDRIIGFCGDVPGFSKLNVDDQKILTKRAYYDIWMLCASQFFINGESYLVLPDDSFYSRQWMNYVIGAENVNLLLDFAESFNRLALNELEISILSAIELTSPGHVDIDLKDAPAIQKLNSLYLDLLVHVITKRNPDNSSRILVDIFRLLPKLAEINKMQRDLIANFSKDKPPS